MWLVFSSLPLLPPPPFFLKLGQFRKEMWNQTIYIFNKNPLCCERDGLIPIVTQFGRFFSSPFFFPLFFSLFPLILGASSNTSALSQTSREAQATGFGPGRLGRPLPPSSFLFFFFFFKAERTPGTERRPGESG